MKKLIILSTILSIITHNASAMLKTLCTLHFTHIKRSGTFYHTRPEDKYEKIAQRILNGSDRISRKTPPIKQGSTFATDNTKTAEDIQKHSTNSNDSSRTAENQFVSDLYVTNTILNACNMNSHNPTASFGSFYQQE